MTTPAIHVEKLTKRYGAAAAVDDVSFDVHAREVVGFLGPNGAGKSTTLRIIAGFLGRSSGTVTVAGFDVEDQALEAKKRLGYMPEMVPLYPEMRVSEYLRFRAELKGVARASRSSAVDDSMQAARIVDVADMLIGRLSKGYRQRVGLADALVAKPPVIVLDEPTAGLDPNQIRDVREVIKALGREHAVLVSTHILSEVEATCDRVLLLGKGKLLAQGTLDEMRALRQRRASLEIVARGEREVALRAVRECPSIESAAAENEDAGVLVMASTLAEGVDPGVASEEVVEALARAGVKVREIRPRGDALEDVFAELTRTASPPNAPANERAPKRRGRRAGQGDDEHERRGR